MRQLITIKTYHVTKISQRHRIWTDPVIRTKQRRMNIRFGTSNVMSLCTSGSLNSSQRISKVKIRFCGCIESWAGHRGHGRSTGLCFFSVRKERKIISWEQDFFVHHRKASAVNRVENVSGRMSYTSYSSERLQV